MRLAVWMAVLLLSSSAKAAKSAEKLKRGMYVFDLYSLFSIASRSFVQIVGDSFQTT